MLQPHLLTQSTLNTKSLSSFRGQCSTILGVLGTATTAEFWNHANEQTPLQTERQLEGPSFLVQKFVILIPLCCKGNPLAREVPMPSEPCST